jgi:hypothetical protein
MIQLGETLSHPVFGKMKVLFIGPIDGEECEMLCQLEEFNGTLKVFDALTLSRIKFRVTGLRIVK